MTIEQWWLSVDINRDALLRLIERFHPAFSRQNDMVITAPAAEAMIRKLGIREAAARSITPGFQFTNAVALRLPDIVLKVLNEAYWGMPESVEVHSEPGFYVLCDLLGDYPEEL